MGPALQPLRSVFRAIAGGAALLATTAALSGCAANDSARVYAEYSEAMTLSGRFRRDIAPADAPYNLDDLARNFQQVAFVPEAQLAEYYRDRGEGPRRLSKWEGPIRYRLMGDGVREADQQTVAEIASLLAYHSGLDIRPARANESHNLAIFVITPAGRALLGEAETNRAWYRSSILRAWIEGLNPPCFALFDAGDAQGGVIRDGAIFVKAEMEDPLRRACFIEEFTQTLGLIFDHENVRPSIFNDDQEFIELTAHDRELLEILYDPRMRAGMTVFEAQPILEVILSEREP